MSANNNNDTPEYLWLPREMDERRYNIQNKRYKTRMKHIFYLILLVLFIAGATFAQMATFTTISQIARKNETGSGFNNKSESDENELSKRLIWHMGLLIQLLAPNVVLFISGLWKYIHRPSESPCSRNPDTADKIFVISREILRSMITARFAYILSQLPLLLYPLSFLSIGALQFKQSFQKINEQKTCVHKGLLFGLGILQIASLLPVPIWYGIWKSKLISAVELFLLTSFMSLLFCSIVNYDIAENSDDSKRTWLWKKFQEHFLIKKDAMGLVQNCNSIYLVILFLQMVSFALIGFICTDDSLRNGKWERYRDAFMLLKRDPFGDGKWWILVGITVPYLVYYINHIVNKVSMHWIVSAIPLMIAPGFVAIWLFVIQLNDPNQNHGDVHLLLPCMSLWNSNNRTVSIICWWICLIVMMILQSFSGRHIFKRHRHALVSAEKLFYSRGYNGVCLLQSLIYNRKVIDEDQNRPVNDQHSNELPMIHMCATLYQETKEEMEQLFISIFKTEKYPDSMSEKNSTQQSQAIYDFDAHIMFDDAIKSIEISREEGPIIIVYDFVDNMMSAIKNAAEIVYNSKAKLEDPTVRITPYGAQMIWETPAKKKKIVVHLKDQTKVRRRKRWSQIMYFCYLLTHKIKLKIKNDMQELRECALEGSFSALFPLEIQQKLNNTFILILDGDIDWKPISIQLLLNRLLENEKKAAVCARIKPSGAGLVIWYQKIEYAIQHWFSKVSESVFGCVLCAPGCFSLFRAMAIIDDNVLKTYSKIPKSASDMVKCDQGEDRWLCTLLLSSRSGWCIDYCAASSAKANSPSTFKEFLEQRRRWISSSVLNHFSFIQNGSKIRSINPYIHWYFVWLQFLVFVSDIIGPAFVIIYMTSSLTYIGHSETTAFLICSAPVAIEFYICMFHSKKTQIFVTGILSAFVTLLFTMSVATSIFVAFTQLEDYATFVFPILIGIVIITGMLHPGECKNLIYLPIFLLGTAAMHVIFVIYAACNINDTTWGTREANKENTSAGLKKRPILKLFAYTIHDMFLAWILSKQKNAREFLKDYDDYRLEEENGRITTATTTMQDNHIVDIDHLNHSTTGRNTILFYTTKTDGPTLPVNHDVRWAELDPDANREEWNLEDEFWKSAIKRYNLAPSENETQQRNENSKLLYTFRNQVVAGFFLIIGIVLVAQYQVTTSQEKTGFVLVIHIGGLVIRIDYVTLSLLAIYSLQTAFQIIGMLCHRYHTLLDYLAVANSPEERRGNKNPGTITGQYQQLTAPLNS